LLISWLGERLAPRLEVRPAGDQTLVHPIHPWLGASCDSLVYEGGKAVAVGEAKTAGRRDDWIDDAGDLVVPAYYEAQIQTQMLVARVPRGYVVADLPGEPEPAILPVAADSEYQAAISEAAQVFVEEHLRKRVPPEVSEASYSRIARLHPRPLSDDLEPAPLEVDALAREYLEARAAARAVDEEVERLRARLALLTGDRLGFVGEGWRLAWRRQEETIVPSFTRKAGRIFDLREVKAKAERAPKRRGKDAAE
jgi:hypothetical protein